MASAPVLIVNLEEFAELCGVTAETMRVHIRTVEGDPAWLVERGDRGRGYKIEPEGGLAWWKARREDEERADTERRAQLAQLRMDLVGDNVEAPEKLGLSGKQRREEYAAAFEAVRYRKMMGELVEKAELVPVLTAAAVLLRRRLQSIPGEFAIVAGLSPADVEPLHRLHRRAMEEFLTSIAPVGVARLDSDDA